MTGKSYECFSKVVDTLLVGVSRKPIECFSNLGTPASWLNVGFSLPRAGPERNAYEAWSKLLLSLRVPYRFPGVSIFESSLSFAMVLCIFHAISETPNTEKKHFDDKSCAVVNSPWAMVMVVLGAFAALCPMESERNAWNEDAVPPRESPECLLQRTLGLKSVLCS